MPGFTTHYLFGVKAYNDLPNNYLKHVISKYRWLYQIGLNEIAAISSKQQREQAISYMAGFLCHYAADSICHPYVYGRIQYETDGKGSRFHGLHAELENDIDTLLLRKFKHKKPSEFNQAATICLNGQEIQFLSRFLSRCINETYYPITERNIFQVTEGSGRPQAEYDPVF